jgi:quercetin dioxygenase-like cupin family protein
VETINGCSVVPAPETPDPTMFGPGETRGSYLTMVGVFLPGQPAPPLHKHPHTDEAFYLGSGEATFQLGDREVHVPAGSLVFVPRGTPHTVWNSGEEPIRGLILVSPGDAEHVFEPVAA